MALASDVTQIVIHLVRVLAEQVIRLVDADLLQPATDCCADVGDVGEGLDVGSVHSELSIEPWPGCRTQVA